MNDLRLAVVFCPNGEPLDLWTLQPFFGPFEGEEHARLWLEYRHCGQPHFQKAGSPARCAHNSIDEHRVIRLEQVA